MFKATTCLFLVFIAIRTIRSAIPIPGDPNRRVPRLRHDSSVNASIDQLFPRPETGRRPCDTEQIEYRLTKLEVQLAEKAENLRSELREGNRRLQQVEWQSTEVQTAVENFRNELGRFTEASQPFPKLTNDNDLVEKLELRIDNLSKGVQLMIAALRGLNSDMGFVKRNISKIENTTNDLLRIHEELVTKQFFSNGLLEVKHQQLYQPYTSSACPSGVNTEKKYPKNCKEVQEQGNSDSGIYYIQPELAHKPFLVVCNLGTRGGGWTYIHNRFDGTQDFYLNWHNYKHGFGNLGGEFWLGLEYVHLLTGSQVNELLIELQDMNEQTAYAHYGAFSIGNEVEGYSLKILGAYSGDAGDSLVYHAGNKFSTKDMDQDGWPEGSCAQAHGGAWWYRGCDTSNLNGKYLNGELPEEFLYQGMYWGDFRGAQYSLRQARMMIRPRSEHSLPIFPDGIVGNRKN